MLIYISAFTYTTGTNFKDVNNFKDDLEHCFFVELQSDFWDNTFKSLTNLVNERCWKNTLKKNILIQYKIKFII